MTSKKNVPYGTKLRLYKELLIKWQNSVNLVGASTLNEIEERHFADSLALLSYIPSTTEHILDLGSGAGFPGLVIAIATNIHTTLIESDRKKCQFLREAKRLSQANATIENHRIESYKGPKAQVITSRALASVDKLLEYSHELLTQDGFLLLLKGKNAKNEIADAEKRWHFNYEIFPSETSLEGHIIKIWDIHDKRIRHS